MLTKIALAKKISDLETENQNLKLSLKKIKKELADLKKGKSLVASKYRRAKGGYEKFKKFCPGHDEAKKTYMKNYTDDLAIKDPEPEEGQKAGTTSKTTDTLNGTISTQSAEPPQP